MSKSYRENELRNIIKIRFKMLRDGVEEVCSNLSEEEVFLCEKMQVNTQRKDEGTKKRFGHFQYQGVVILAVTQELKYLNSSKLFERDSVVASQFLSYILQQLSNYREDSLRNHKRLVHNIVTYNAQTNQELEYLFPQEITSKKSQVEKLGRLQESILEAPKETAQSLLKIAKYNHGVKFELSVFDKLYNPNLVPKIELHKVHKVIMNVLYLFFPDFTDKRILVNLSPTEHSAYFDYESIQVCLYHLLGNTTKYAQENSRVDIDVNNRNDEVEICFRMHSLRIDKEETERIFEEGYSGIYAKKCLAHGSGLGMYLVKELLRINKGEVAFKADYSKCTTHKDLMYDENQFVLRLPMTLKKI